MSDTVHRRRLLGAGLGVAAATMTREALSQKDTTSEGNGGGRGPDARARRASPRSAGEDYHERALEEQYVFPRESQLKGEAARLPDVLKTQHERGRAITDYILAVTVRGSVASANATPLANTLDAFVLMYQHHTALEDTILFPAWKQALSDSEYHELSERFEDLEHKMFGKDGFEDALKRIGQVERDMGIADLVRFTAPRPPRPTA